MRLLDTADQRPSFSAKKVLHRMPINLLLAVSPPVMAGVNRSIFSRVSIE